MIILKPAIFRQFPEIIFGFSTKRGADKDAPYFFNLSHSVGDKPDTVTENRATFFEGLGLFPGNVAIQRQVHGDNITYVDSGGLKGESDAIITDKPGIGIGIGTADCTPVFIYDRKNKVISGIHSGWRSTQKRIVEITLIKLQQEYNSNPEHLYVYLAPSISQGNYEVGSEVAEQFDGKYLKPHKEKFLLDVAGANYDILVKSGVPKNQIQRSDLCTFEMAGLLHSYRRDGKVSGRALGVIAIKG